MDSEHSLTDLCECGHIRSSHGYGPRCIGNRNLCACLGFRLKKADLVCTCGCPKGAHMGKPQGCISHGFHEFRCDHTRCGWKPREEPEEEAHVYVSPAHCKACMRAWIGPDAVLEDEPPLTPEEEEEAASEPCSEHPDAPVIGGMCGGCTQYPEDMVVKPPQPERRPPYVVAYSVQGHLFEVALSGDATVRAVDGALVIQHHLGPVAGIVSVLPVINKES